MRTVHKYFTPLASGDDRCILVLPINSVPLMFARQGSEYCVWVEVETSFEMGKIEVRIFGTGHAIPADYNYIGSTVADPYVWHAYWRKA